MSESLYAALISGILAQIGALVAIWLFAQMPNIKRILLNNNIKSPTFLLLTVLISGTTSFILSAVYFSFQTKQFHLAIEDLNKRIDSAHISIIRSNKLYDIGDINGEGTCDGPNDFVYGFKNATVNNQALDQWRCASVNLTFSK